MIKSMTTDKEIEKERDRDRDRERERDMVGFKN